MSVQTRHIVCRDSRHPTTAPVMFANKYFLTQNLEFLGFARCHRDSIPASTALGATDLRWVLARWWTSTLPTCNVSKFQSHTLISYDNLLHPSFLYCTSKFAGGKFALICKSYGIVSQMHSEPDYPLSSITYPSLSSSSSSH